MRTKQEELSQIYLHVLGGRQQIKGPFMCNKAIFCTCKHGIALLLNGDIKGKK